MFSLHALLDALPLLIKAAQATVLISLVGLVVGFVVAIGVCSARLSKNVFVSKLGGAYVGFFRGVPLLVQLLLTYYFLPFIGINVPPLVAAAAAVSLCEAAYLAEILRGGFIGIPHGQLEAAQLLGLSRVHAVLRIQVPQALRMTLPSLVNEMISVVGVADVTRTAQNIAASTYRPLEAYVAAGLVYLVINGALSLAGHRAERRLAQG
jgi:polar amino acid transport system permease protein